MSNHITTSTVSMSLYDQAQGYATGCAFYWVRELSLETKVLPRGYQQWDCEVHLVDYWNGRTEVSAKGSNVAETMKNFIQAVIAHNNKG